MKYQTAPEEATSGSSSEIKMKMTMTRARIDETFDELSSQLDPQKLAGSFAKQISLPGVGDDGKFNFQNVNLPELSRKISAKSGPYFKKHPISSALIATGVFCAGLEAAGMLPDAPTASQWTGDTWRNSKKAVRERKARLADAGREKAVAAKESLQRLREGTSASLPDIDPARVVGRSKESVSKSFKNNPVPFGLAALGAGLLVGLALPATRKEKQALAPLGKSLEEEAKRSLAGITGQVANHVDEHVSS